MAQGGIDLSIASKLLATICNMQIAKKAATLCHSIHPWERDRADSATSVAYLAQSRQEFQEGSAVLAGEVVSIGDEERGSYTAAGMLATYRFENRRVGLPRRLHISRGYEGAKTGSSPTPEERNGCRGQPEGSWLAISGRIVRIEPWNGS
jgi:hypothetical protein